MADGRRFSVAGDSAASKSLPLGTTAKVVSVESGKSAIIKVEDRGPYVRDRVLDVSPKVAESLGMKKAGVFPILVRPIAVPQADGSIKLGAGAADASPQQVREAVKATQELAWQQGR
jgi:rare lipoprotein A